MIIQATRSLFVLVGSMIYLSILPEMLQLIGGLITIVGVIVMTWGKMRVQHKKRQEPEPVPALLKLTSQNQPNYSLLLNLNLFGCNFLNYFFSSLEAEMVSIPALMTVL